LTLPFPFRQGIEKKEIKRIEKESLLKVALQKEKTVSYLSKSPLSIENLSASQGIVHQI